MNFEDDDEDSDYEDDRTALSDCGVSEFCGTVTGFADVDAAALAIIGGGYYDQDISVMTGNKSQAFLNRKNGAKSSPTSILKNSSGTGTISHKKSTKHFSPSFIPEYILDVWKDTRPNNRCSITFLVESGRNRHKELKIRVSTDGNFLVINKKKIRVINKKMSTRSRQDYLITTEESSTEKVAL